MEINRLVRRTAMRWNVRGIPRLLFASRHHLLGRQPGLFELENHIRLYLDPDDYVQCMMFYDVYSREILNVLRHFVKPGDTVIDVGAHIGYFSLHLGALVTNLGRVYSFEPDQRARDALVKSVRASGMEWVEVLPLALAACGGSIDFYLAKGLGSSSAVKSIQQQDAARTVVSTASLDELIRTGRVKEDVRVIKIDVEGFEVEVIRGMQTLLRARRPIMIIEVNKEMLEAKGESPSSLFGLLKSFNYSISALVKPPRGKYREGVQTISVKNQTQEGYYDVLCLPTEDGPN